MTHTHTDAAINSSSDPHSHDPTDSSLVTCGYNVTYKHAHSEDFAEGGAHNHGLTLHFGPAALGSPNWWEHKHLITGECAAGGVSHSHTPTLSPAACAACSANPHGHTNSLSVTAAVHSHTDHAISGWTDYADPAGTPENHTHTFTITLGYNEDGFTHTVTGSINAANCYLGYSHLHARGSPTGPESHNHTGSGTSGAGGESAAAVMRVFGDGWAWICG